MAIPSIPTGGPRTLASDSQQAAYFRGALVEHRALVTAEIARQTRTLSHLSTKSDALAISRLRRQIRANETECRHLDHMIAAIDRRFSTNHS